jgi:hypothetical protein
MMMMPQVLANAAVFPDSRKILRGDIKFLTRLEALLTKGTSELIKKHAAIAREMVLWQP